MRSPDETTGGGESNDDSQRTEPGASPIPGGTASRRAVLSALVAGGALAPALSATTVVGAADDDDADAPPTPENLNATTPVWGPGIELSWEGPADPCDGRVSEYVVTREGEAVTSVPAGVTRARIKAPEAGDDPAAYGVTAVADDGVESAVATTEASAAGEEPPLRASVVPRVDGEAVDSVEPAEVVTADVVVRPGAEDVPDLDEFYAEIQVSTPCAVEIVDASYADAFEETMEPEFYPDPHVVSMWAMGFSGDIGDEVVLATLELATLDVGGTELSFLDVVVGNEEVGGVEPADDWTALSIEPASEDGPPAPSNLEVRDGLSTSIDVFWDGVDDPCDASLSHYSIAVDGREVATVPIGITSLTHYPVGEPPFSVTARTVDVDGNESYPVSDRIEEVFIADPGLSVSASPSADTILVGETIEVPITLSEGLGEFPDTFSFEVDVSVSTPCAVQLTGGSYDADRVLTAEELPGDWDTLTILPQVYGNERAIVDPAEPVIADDGSSATFEVDGITGSFDRTTFELATVEFTGQRPGATEIHVSFSGRDRNGSFDVLERWRTLEVEPRPELPAIGDNDAPPQDLDGDGLYRDVDGTGSTGSNDVVTFFHHLEDEAITDHAAAYDFNESGGVGFDDVVALFKQV